MKWDVFRPRGKATRNSLEEAIERLVKVIERTAPADHHLERERCYYNYKIMALYRRPLLRFLETVADRERLKGDPELLAKEIFLSLKGFYDPRDRASRERVLNDPGFLRKFSQVYACFYGADAPAIRDILGKEGIA